MNWTIWIAVGSISAGLSVAFGAFAAHGLRERLASEALAVFEVGARYQMYHALAMIACGLIASRIDVTALKVAAWAFLAGSLLFSGSLYAIALTGIRPLGMITPVGGVCFLLGWAALAYTALIR